MIELKGTETTDLDKIESQAFGYKNNQPTAVYVITSNFEKLRFYIDDAVDYLDFNLFTLDEQQFKLLYLCLHKDHIYSNLPKKIKGDSTLQEENITKKLYQDYSTFKKALFNNLVEHNPDHSKLALFKKLQKLLDRFLFIFFAEDKGLLPPNSVSQIVENYHQLMKLDFYQSLYDVFRQYFSYIDKGRPAKGNKAEIFNFNGGLFEPDELLDNLTISDEILLKHTLVLSKYDFDSEVDVNILGHIFEHSLNEIDEMAAEIEGQTIDKSTTKRKKDGVFYTPKYITKYIVENTVGKLCEEKKNELGIIEEEYAKDRKGRKKATLISLKDKLEQYRNWLLSLTICDPACGSGAFLNQALDFLIEEHRYIDELQTKLLGGGFVFPNVENSILENNLYGVDINEESVEIAKLSLWLRTVKKGRQLTSLNNNIKCGNSLIDDVEVAGDKAFKWEKEFPQVFVPKDKQAFHVVLTMHNSRTSQRMIKLDIEKGDGIWLSIEEEILLTGFIRDVIKESGYHCLAYNICGDHVHLILVCELSELSKQIQKIKSISSKRFNIAIGKTIPQVIPPRGHDPLSSDHTHLSDKKMSDTSTTRGHDPLEGKISEVERTSKKGKTQNHLWSQKFFRADLDVWEWGQVSTRPGYVYQDTHLGNALAYIDTNREKHDLPDSPELKMIIEEMTCSQETAFELEYKGGVDVVVGNPPYGAKLTKIVQKYLNGKYIKGASETAIAFIKLSFDLLQNNGELSFIIPKSFSYSSKYAEIRKYIFDSIYGIVDCRKVWKDVKLEQVIFVVSKSKKTSTYFSSIISNRNIFMVGEIDKNTFNKFGFYLNGITSKELEIGSKMRKKNIFLNDISKNSRGGMFQKFISENGDLNVLGGAEIQRHGVIGLKGKVNKKIIENDKKATIEQNSILVQNIVAHIENPTDHIKITACYPSFNDYVIVDTINQITVKKEINAKVIWLLLNSKLLNWYCYRFIFGKAIRTMHFDNSVTSKVPIPIIEPQVMLIEQANKKLEFNEIFAKKKRRFLNRLQSSLSLPKTSKKIESFYDYNFKTLVTELKKQKITLSLVQQDEWEEYFTAYKLHHV